MNKEVFRKITIEAHRLTRWYIATFPEFKVDYRVQYGIFFKLSYQEYLEEQRQKESDYILNPSTQFDHDYNRLIKVLKGLYNIDYKNDILDAFCSVYVNFDSSKFDKYFI